MKTTLSNTQWQHLQSLFDRAEQMERVEVDALIASLRQDDALIAETLSAMLSAHRQWQQRTGAAIETLAEAVSPSAVGARLGAFTLVKEIGRGGMGTVYLGERADGQVQQQVAIKVLHARNLDDNTRTRFQREREILAAFDHPGIARLLDVGESEAGEPYYVMEYLRGLPIDAHCDQHRLGIRERLNLFRSICDAVQYAHGKLILHRDIKPSNIIVDAAGVPKLIDFGIAKPIHLLDAVSVEETATHQRYFSPVNAAPEQIRGESVSVACDVYQLGTLLHELLCGRPIFEWKGSSVSDLEQKISAITPDAPSAVAASATDEVIQTRSLSSRQALARAVSGDLDAIVQRAVRKEPQSRYASVEQLSQDIERHLQDQPVLGRRGERAYRFSRFVKRNWRGCGVVLVALISVSAFTWQLYRQNQKILVERDRAVEASNRAEEVASFLVDIFKSGNPAEMQRPDAPIRLVLDRGLELLGQRLAKAPLIRAKLSETLATIYVSLDDTKTAGDLILQSVELRESMADTDPSGFAQHLQTAGFIMLMNNRFDDSKKLLQRAMSIFESMDADLSVTWKAQLYLLRLSARDNQAIACPQMEDLSTRLLNMGRDFYLESSTVFLSAAHCGAPTNVRTDWRIQRAHTLIASMDSSILSEETAATRLKLTLVTLLLHKRQVVEADKLNLDLMPLLTRVYGDQSWFVADALMARGISAFQQRDYSEAKLQLSQAEASYQRIVKGQSHPDIAAVSHALGRLHEVGFDDTPTALNFYSKAAQIGREGDGPGSSYYAIYATDYALLMLRLGDRKNAEPLLRDAIRILTADQAHGVRARIGLATILAELPDRDEAERLLRISAEGLNEAEKDSPGTGETLRLLRQRLHLPISDEETSSPG
jgi:eukaryotic-like serine/threonine-protein kinase